MESDLDLAVMGNESLTETERFALVRDLALEIGRPVDLVDIRKTHGTLLGEILRNGTPVQRTDLDLFAEVLRRHLFDTADFAPYRDRILTERREAWIAGLIPSSRSLNPLP